MPPKPGDWFCNTCKMTIFASKPKCNKCGAMKPGAAQGGGASGAGSITVRAGDWTCPNKGCNNLNFASRSVCNKCGTSKDACGPTPATTTAGGATHSFPRTPDWQCCGQVVFGSKAMCFKCARPNPHLVSLGLLVDNNNANSNAAATTTFSAAAAQSSKAAIAVQQVQNSALSQLPPAPSSLAQDASASAAASSSSSDNTNNNNSEGSTSMPPLRCFKRAPQLNFENSLRVLLTSFTSAPINRPDLAKLVPDQDDFLSTFKFITGSVLPTVKARPSVQKIISDCAGKLTDDHICALIAYKIETPFAVYRWLNGWLASSDRSGAIVDAVGPFFTLLYRACELLPKIKSRAARSAIVGNIPALRQTFDNYQVRCAPGAQLSFWAWSSFSTDDKVINSPMFMGAGGAEAIVYTVGSLIGASLDEFAPAGFPAEKEILPLCPAVFKIQSSVKVQTKLVVTLEQCDSGDFAYVMPMI